MPKNIQLVLTGLLVLIAAFLYLNFKPVSIRGESMSPNYLSGSRYIVSKFSFYKPSRFDVVLYSYSMAPGYSAIGRVIGLPGESLTISQGKVLINGNPLAEKYLSADTMTKITNKVELVRRGDGTSTLEENKKASLFTEGKAITIPDNSYFIMGDNRSKSIDSRGLGFISAANILGKLILKY